VEDLSEIGKLHDQLGIWVPWPLEKFSLSKAINVRRVQIWITRTGIQKN